MKSLCKEYAKFQIPQPLSDKNVPGIKEERWGALYQYDSDSLDAFLKEKGYAPFKEDAANVRTPEYHLYGRSTFMTVYAIIHWVIFVGFFVAMCFVCFNLIKDDYFGSAPLYKIILSCVAASAIVLAFPAYLWHKLYAFVEDTVEDIYRRKREKKDAEKQKQLDDLREQNEKLRSELTEQFYSDFEVRCAAERSKAYHKDVLARDKFKRKGKKKEILSFASKLCMMRTKETIASQTNTSSTRKHLMQSMTFVKALNGQPKKILI